MMSPKTKLIVGGVGAAAVTSSVVMSSVALANQETSTVQEEKKTTEVTRKEFDDLKIKVDKLPEVTTKDFEGLDTRLKNLEKPGSKVTEEQFNNLSQTVTELQTKITNLEVNKPAEDEATTQVSREEFEAQKSEINKLNEDIKRIDGELNKGFPKVSEDEEFKKLQSQFNTLTSYVDNKHAEYKRDLDEEKKTIKKEVESKLNNKLEEIKKILAKAEEIKEKVENMEQMANPVESNNYMQKLAEHAQTQRAEIMKELVDVRNKFNGEITKLRAELAAIKK